MFIIVIIYDVMAHDATSSYPTLRRTRTALRVLAPIGSAIALLIGLGLFASVAPRLLSPGYGVAERMIWGVIGLGYLIGAPIVSFVFFFLLRAAADLIDLWIDGQVAAEKTASLMERQLVPGVLRMCQLLEKANESQSGSNVAPRELPPADGKHDAFEAVRDAMRRESWEQARQLAHALAEQNPESGDAKQVMSQVETAFRRKLQSLREQIDHAERSGDANAIMDSRDRLSGYLNGTELYQVDRRVAHWMARYLREALADGRAKEVVHLAERVVDVLGDTTTEGAQVRAALPTLRRAAGLCPDCGQPYDVSRVRCAACESKEARPRTRLTRS